MGQGVDAIRFTATPPALSNGPLSITQFLLGPCPRFRKSGPGADDANTDHHSHSRDVLHVVVNGVFSFEPAHSLLYMADNTRTGVPFRLELRIRGIVDG